jgi:hypothetical protein
MHDVGLKGSILGVVVDLFRFLFVLHCIEMSYLEILNVDRNVNEAVDEMVKVGVVVVLSARFRNVYLLGEDVLRKYGITELVTDGRLSPRPFIYSQTPVLLRYPTTLPNRANKT